MYLPTRLAYCHSALLPIWERWTGGHPAMRSFLECWSSDPAGHEGRLHELVEAAAALRGSGRDTPGARAAWLAASACLKAAMGVPEPDWRQALVRAVAADREAGARAE